MLEKWLFNYWDTMCLNSCFLGSLTFTAFNDRLSVPAAFLYSSLHSLKCLEMSDQSLEMGKKKKKGLNYGKVEFKPK